MQKENVKGLYKFILLLSVLIIYFFYLSWKYDVATGGLVSVFTWSFFVLCTPIADAGFLVDFPVRLIMNVRMIHSEIVVWSIAISLNIWGVYTSPDLYKKTLLTEVFYKILVTPVPYWTIIILCFMGTFLSIHMGDEIMDAVKLRNKKRQISRIFILKTLSFGALLISIFYTYYILLKSLNLSIDW